MTCLNSNRRSNSLYSNDSWLMAASETSFFGCFPTEGEDKVEYLFDSPNISMADMMDSTASPAAGRDVIHRAPHQNGRGDRTSMPSRSSLDSESFGAEESKQKYQQSYFLSKTDTLVRFLTVIWAFPFILVISSVKLDHQTWFRSIWGIRIMNLLIYIGPVIYVKYVLSVFLGSVAQRVAIFLYTFLYLFPVASIVGRNVMLAGSSSSIEDGTFCFKPGRQVRFNFSNACVIGGFIFEWVQVRLSFEGRGSPFLTTLLSPSSSHIHLEQTRTHTHHIKHQTHQTHQTLFTLFTPFPQHTLYVLPLGIVTGEEQYRLSDFPPYLPFEIYIWGTIFCSFACGLILILNTTLQGKLHYRFTNSYVIWLFLYNVGRYTSPIPIPPYTPLYTPIYTYIPYTPPIHPYTPLYTPVHPYTPPIHPYTTLNHPMP